MSAKSQKPARTCREALFLFLLVRGHVPLALVFSAEDGFEVLGAAIGVYGVGGVFEGTREVEEGEPFGEGCQPCEWACAMWVACWSMSGGSV